MTGVSTSCGACKFLRRKCTSECVFAPYFRYDQARNSFLTNLKKHNQLLDLGVKRYEQAPQHFAAVHKVFGSSNASRLLLQLPEQCRSEAAIAMCFEALARMQDPVYGCVAYVYALQQKVVELQREVETLSNHMANLTITYPSSGLEFPPPSTSVTDMQQYGTQHNKWTEHSENIDNRVLEECRESSQPAYGQGNFPSISDFNPFETHLGGVISQESFDCLPWLPSNS